MKKRNFKYGCCRKTHAKIFEIILIFGFIISISLLTINLILTRWFFKSSYYLFIIEIGLLSINFISLIFTIILRVWRSNRSVFKQHYSTSLVFSILILILIIINILCSIAEDVLFYFIYYSISLSDNVKGHDKSQKIRKIVDNIMNNKKSKGDSYKGLKDDKKIQILKVIPWIAINVNTFIQILSLIFIIFILKRIKIKSNYGINPFNKSSLRNQIGSNKHLGFFDSNKNNNNKGKKLKKGKKEKNGKFDKKNNIFTTPNSDQLGINKKNKNKKKLNRKKKNHKNK